jgi:intraflagellar transport protein 140
MTDVARYFEKLGDLDKAIALYSKSGNIQKALSLCYKTKNISMMESIISRLDPVTDESSLKNISKFLADHGSHESALKLLITSQKFQEVL